MKKAIPILIALMLVTTVAVSCGNPEELENDPTVQIDAGETDEQDEAAGEDATPAGSGSAEGADAEDTSEGYGAVTRTEGENMKVDPDKLTEDLDEEALKELNGGSVSIVYHPETGVPKQIDGVFSSKMIFSVEDALCALMSVRTIMDIGCTEFVCVGTNLSEDEEYNTYLFRQLYEGLVVDHSFFRVLAGKDGTPRSVYALSVNGLDLDPTPAVTHEEGENAVPVSDGTYLVSHQLVVYGNGGVPCLAWKYFVGSDDPLREKDVYVDAQTGQLISIVPSAAG